MEILFPDGIEPQQLEVRDFEGSEAADIAHLKDRIRRAAKTGDFAEVRGLYERLMAYRLAEATLLREEVEAGRELAKLEGFYAPDSRGRQKNGALPTKIEEFLARRRQGA